MCHEKHNYKFLSLREPTNSVQPTADRTNPGKVSQCGSFLIKAQIAGVYTYMHVRVYVYMYVYKCVCVECKYNLTQPTDNYLCYTSHYYNHTQTWYQNSRSSPGKIRK